MSKFISKAKRLLTDEHYSIKFLKITQKLSVIMWFVSAGLGLISSVIGVLFLVPIVTLFSFACIVLLFIFAGMATMLEEYLKVKRGDS